MAADLEAPAHPDPPYTQECDAKLRAGLQCYYPGCTSKFHSYASILSHVTNVRGAHKRSMRLLNGTYLHTQGTKEINARKRNMYKKGQESKGADGPQPKQLKSENLKDEQAPPIPSSQPSICSPMSESCHKWVAMKCWVKCNSDGSSL